MIPNLNTSVVVLAPGETRQFAVSGQFFFCTAATAPFSMSIDGGSYNTILAGIAFPTAQPFSRLLLQDTSGSGCAITFMTGEAGIAYYPPSVTSITKGAPTYTKGSATIALGAGATWDFLGLDGANVRKQIVVTNLDGAAQILKILDKTGVIGATVYPQRGWTIETSGKVTVKNPNGGAINFEVLETFYS